MLVACLLHAGKGWMTSKQVDLKKLSVELVKKADEPKFKSVMAQYHYLGFLPKISETLWYAGVYDGEWTSLLSFSASSLKCSARDRWIGWDYRHQFGRLKLIVNNSRYLILPDWHISNLGSRILSLCLKRLQTDWQRYFEHTVVLVETYVDPSRFHGGLYRASNWLHIGATKGYRRKNRGYSAVAGDGKWLFVKPLVNNVRRILTQPLLEQPFINGRVKMYLTADQMRSLPEFFSMIPDPRRAEGRKHSIATVLGIAAAAILCGMRGYKGITDWASSLGQKARLRFGCRFEDGHYVVPSLSSIRRVIISVDPVELEQALQAWNVCYAVEDESLAIDGKVMCNALDDEGRQTHIMSAIGHGSKTCYTQKKSVLFPSGKTQ